MLLHDFVHHLKELYVQRSGAGVTGSQRGLNESTIFWKILVADFSGVIVTQAVDGTWGIAGTAFTSSEVDEEIRNGCNRRRRFARTG